MKPQRSRNLTSSKTPDGPKPQKTVSDSLKAKTRTKSNKQSAASAKLPRSYHSLLKMPKTRKTRLALQQQQLKIRNKRECHAKDHDGSLSSIINVKRKAVKVSVRNALISNGQISEKTKYVCEKCIQKYGNRDGEDVESSNVLLDFPESVPDIDKTPILLCPAIPIAQSSNETGQASEVSDQVSDIQSNEEDLKLLVTKIEEDVRSLYKERPCKDTKSVLNHDIAIWLSERPPALLSHLRSLCKLDESTKSNFVLATIIETIYKCHNKMLVLPLSFKENIVTYKLSNSSILTALNGSTKPSGAHTFSSDWLNSASSEPLKVPRGFVRIVFDNEQVIGKRYRVRAKESKVPATLITSYAYLIVDQDNLMQNREEMKPKHWMFKDITEDFSTKIIESFNTGNVVFRSSRNELLQKRLVAVSKGLTLNSNDGIVDEIELIVAEKKAARTNKVCSTCGHLGSITQRICKSCKGKMISQQQQQTCATQEKIDPYSHFSITPKENNIKVLTGEPDMIKPNSVENVKQLLFATGRRANISNFVGSNVDPDPREWMCFENDGGILGPILKLIFNLLRCLECKNQYFGKDSFDGHLCKGALELKYEHVFDWIVPQMGLLHLEINAGKSFMNLCWDVFMKSVCIELGFKSPNALLYAKKGTDHHKLWDILEITYIAFADEIMFQFISYCFNKSLTPTIDNYWLFASQAKNPNFLFVQQMVMSFLHAMMLLRRGTRFQDSDYIYSAKNKLALMFFARNHPNYHYMFVKERRIELAMPSDVLSMKMKSLSMSRISNVGHYQSGDAIIEEINKEAKRDLVGVPDDVQWQRSFRNLDNVNKIRSSYFSDAGITDPKGQVFQRERDISEEVRKVRVLIRESQYLDNPLDFVPHTDLTKTIKLSDQLVNIVDIGQKNLASYTPMILKGMAYKMNIVFTTEQEKTESEKIENLSIKDITQKILLELENREDKQLQTEVYNKDVRGKVKQNYVNFYNSLMESREEIDESCHTENQSNE